jgi:uncharacterized protein
MEQRLSQIERGVYRFKSLEHPPEWQPLMGPQLENLVVNSRSMLHAAVQLDANSVVNENPYFLTVTADQPGCQIDFMIQTKFSCLYIYEIRFSTRPIGAEVIREVQDKINRLRRPKHFSCRPVLIHINGVTPELIESDYFAHVSNVGQWLDWT